MTIERSTERNHIAHSIFMKKKDKSDKAVQEAIEEANRIMQEKYGDNWNDGSEEVSLPIPTWDDILNESGSHKWVFNRVNPVDHPLTVTPQRKIPPFKPHSGKIHEINKV